MIQGSFEGFAELAAQLRMLPDAVRKKALYEVLKAAAAPMRNEMEQTAKKGGDAPHLADNINVSIATRIGSVEGGKWEDADEFTAAVAVGPTRQFFYGLFLEYGTVRTAGASWPFMRPSFDGNTQISLNIVRDQLWELIRKQNGKGSSPGQKGTGAGSPGGAGTL